jgi:hypothetical protein
MFLRVLLCSISPEIWEAASIRALLDAISNMNGTCVLDSLSLCDSSCKRHILKANLRFVMHTIRMNNYNI